MRDDAWWDGDDEDERIASLQRVLAPLREPPRPWGDVLAQARIGAAPRERSRVFPIAMLAGVAAAIAVGWLWGRSAPQTVVVEREVNVASPPEVRDVPIAVPVPVPIPITPPREEVAPSVAPEAVDPPKIVRARAKPRAPREKARSPGEDVDCILDPNLAKCRGAQPVPRYDDGLPETLTTGDIKAAMAKVKGDAQRCGERYDAQPGEQVKVKLSVAGETGRVTQSVAIGTHADTELGQCVARAIEAAQFPRFRKPHLGVVYPIVM
ncbi:MAG TPA: hypothetical protein VG755_41410 [Nannocystaceae bacterium]|nr:hypothetical protein [Nannocystaceae bacterium]